MCTTMSLTNELHIKIGDAAQLTMKERHIGKFHVWSSCLAPWTSAAVMPLHRGEHLSLERNERHSAFDYDQGTILCVLSIGLTVGNRHVAGVGSSAFSDGAGSSGNIHRTSCKCL